MYIYLSTYLCFFNPIIVYPVNIRKDIQYSFHHLDGYISPSVCVMTEKHFLTLFIPVLKYSHGKNSKSCPVLVKIFLIKYWHLESGSVVVATF